MNNTNIKPKQVFSELCLYLLGLQGFEVVPKNVYPNDFLGGEKFFPHYGEKWRISYGLGKILYLKLSKE